MLRYKSCTSTHPSTWISQRSSGITQNSSFGIRLFFFIEQLWINNILSYINQSSYKNRMVDFIRSMCD